MTTIKIPGNKEIKENFHIFVKKLVADTGCPWYLDVDKQGNYICKPVQYAWAGYSVGFQYGVNTTLEIFQPLINKYE